MKKIAFILIVCVVSIVLYIVWSQNSNRALENTNESLFSLLPASPLDATYLHEGENVTFENGEYSDENHMLTITRDPLYGDVDGDGTEDAVLLVTDSNADTFYLGLALNDETGFLGLQTVPLEVLSEPDIHIHDEIISVQKENGASANYVLTGTTLGLHEADGVLTRGTYVFKNEQQTFSPCSSSTTYWISPTSSALPVLASIYAERSKTTEGIRSVYAVVTGKETAVPTEGIGAEYDRAYEITTVVKAPETGQCTVGSEQKEETATST